MSGVKTCKDVESKGGSQTKKDPPPLNRVKEEATINPCSGRYEGGSNGVSIQLMVDVDKLREYSTKLDVVSGTVSVKNAGDGPWSGNAVSIYFTAMGGSLKYSGQGTDSRKATAQIKAAFNDGEKAGGELCVKLTNNRGWKAEVDIQIDDQPKLSFKSVERTSTFFKDVNIDIDYTEKVTWPIVELYNLYSQPAGMEKRKIDAFSAFEDAGLKLHFDQEKNSELVSDPTERTPWTKADLYEIMRNYFDETDGSDDNIWCMMGTTPPDKRYMGFSFDRKGKHGFALFTGHTSFIGMDSDKPSVKAVAQRRLLHYFVHECGHCLGLKHPFEIGVEDSLSWMNYAWRYDCGHEPGSFYDNFQYTFSDQELMILRHSPGKAFTTACSSSVLASIMGKGYRIKSDVPDLKLADDDSDDDDEDTVGGGAGTFANKRPKYSKPRPMRKIVMDLRIQTEPFVKGQLFSFEARIKNVGKLPALIEGDLSLESGNLQLYLTDPDGSVQVIDPFVRPIQSGFNRPLVLYTPEDEEGLDRYSELVIVGEGSQGYQFSASGKYELRAVYTGGRYKVTSATYPVTIVDDDDEDEETRNEILEAATLQTSSWSRFKKAKEFWEKVTSKTIEHKKKHVTALMCVMEGLCKESTRQPVSSKKTRSSKRKVTFSTGKPILTPEQLLRDTDDIVAYYQDEGEKKDNHVYSKLVLTRCKLALMAGKIQEADNEFNKLLANLVTRRVKYEVLQRLSKTWNKMKAPVNPEEKMTPQYLQKKVDDVLTWAPSTDGNGEPDLSGIGIGNPFSNFDLDQIKMAVTIVEMLFTKHDETNNLRAVISYADKLQKSREVNYMVVRWALEAFIVHCMAAKRAGIKYPEPEEKDQSVMADAAMVITQRTGEPTENWMNYWRCDADLNYHHRHFHIVYVVSNFLRRDANGNRVISASAPSHLRKQGEIFGYMHTQALARYDADRESWGLRPVQPWTYQERAMSFNAGFEFHNDRQFRAYVPRPNTVWPRGTIRRFMGWQSAYENALRTGIVAPGVELTPNWSGHVLEASSEIYSSTFGNIHNSGHGVFGSTGIVRGSISYMNDTATAMRDSVFYRWHKKIDNMWQDNNDYYRVELAHDGPPVTITADDIIIGSNPQAPAGFNDFKGGEWVSKAPAETSTLKTYLGPPMKKFEWDNKKSHDRFYYHLRVKRNSDARAGNINLTARIFICPKSRQAERKKWIEMDKFVFRIGSNEDHINLTRADRHSSVIKRLPQDMRDDFEQNFVQASGGFCECGWPYNMLLPRGKKEGEEYVVLVMLTNNDIDQIGLRTTCGSLSYCGARGEEYPDSRNMGYPFSNPITMRGQPSQIPEVFNELSNAAYKSFIIQNNVSEPPPKSARDIWYPHLQLGVDDGSSRRQFQTGVTEFVQSDIVGFFRVLVDNDAATPSEGGTLFLRFQGRGGGGGSYTIRDITLGLRFRNTINVVSRTASVTYKGASRFSVPEEGLISDEVNLRFRPALGDYFITFALDSPGVYLPASQRSQTSTYFIRPTPGGPNPVPSDWSSQRIDGRFPHIHCVSAIMTTTSA